MKDFILAALAKYASKIEIQRKLKLSYTFNYLVTLKVIKVCILN